MFRRYERTKLQKARIKLGISQRALAKKIGISQSYLSKLENSQLGGVSRFTIMRLAKALELSKEDILDIFFNDKDMKKIKIRKWG